MVIDDLIKKIFITDIYSDNAKKIIKKAKNTFSDYRNKYNDNVIKLVTKYKELRYLLFFFCIFFFLI